MTLDYYDQLIAYAEREDLKDHVRMAFDCGWPNIGHVWLDTLVDEEWVPFEPLSPLPSLDPNIVYAAAHTLPILAELNGDRDSEDADFRTIPGRRIVVPTRQGWYKASPLYRIISDFKKR